MFVIGRPLAPVVIGLLVGLMFVGIGVAVRSTIPAPGIALFLAIGVPLAIANTRLLITRSPLLRATADGVSFGGSKIVPWSEVKAIHESAFNVQMQGMRTKTSAIAFDFARKRTLLRLPISVWLTSPVGVGDVDVSPGQTGGSTSAIVARLEAMRVVSDSPALAG